MKNGLSKAQIDFYQKTLLMLILAGAIMGVARAGYDDGDAIEQDNQPASESSEVRAAHAASLIKTLSEEFTEVQELASQQARFRQLGDSESSQIARMYGRWIREHKAGVPVLARLIRLHGGNPEDAKELKAPTLGSKEEMLHATHMAHMAAVASSQTRFGIAHRDDDLGMEWFMHKRANLARKHLREMERFHRG
jgi:hypothetical protein